MTGICPHLLVCSDESKVAASLVDTDTPFFLDELCLLSFPTISILAQYQLFVHFVQANLNTYCLPYEVPPYQLLSAEC